MDACEEEDAGEVDETKEDALTKCMFVARDEGSRVHLNTRGYNIR